jgi:hypothetical protein
MTEFIIPGLFVLVYVGVLGAGIWALVTLRRMSVTVLAMRASLERLEQALARR